MTNDENDQIATIKRDFDRDGFVVLRAYLPSQSLAQLRERATRIIANLSTRKAKGDSPARNPKGGTVASKRRSGFGNIIKGLQHHDAWFDHELKSGRHVPLIQTLIEDRPVPSTAAWFTKHPKSTDEVAPHRDAIGLPQGLAAGATMWIALDPADPDNGCLHYGLGSHRRDYGVGIPIPGFDVETEASWPANVQPGDAVIHSSMTVHWSGINRTDRHRRAVSFFYWGASDRSLARISHQPLEA